MKNNVQSVQHPNDNPICDLMAIINTFRWVININQDVNVSISFRLHASTLIHASLHFFYFLDRLVMFSLSIYS